MSKKAPPSPKLLRYDADIKAERNPIKAACLKAERAGFLGRQGFFDEARTALDALQTEFGRRPDASVSIWMQIAEGWIAFYKEEYKTARDHLRRGYALSSAMEINELRALCGAWLAHFSYLQDDFAEMAIYLKVSHALAKPDDHLTQSRLCLVFALAYYFADRLDLAQPWFSKARGHAAASNDDAALSALNYNMTGRRIYYLMVDSIEGRELDKAVTLAKIGMESIYTYDQLLGISLVGEWAETLRAMLLSACKMYSAAASIYDSNLGSSLPKGLVHQKAVYLADSAWCHFNLGQIERASETAADAEKFALADMYVEDQVLVYGRLRQVYFGLNDAARSRQYDVLERDSVNALKLLRQRVLSVLLDSNQKS